MSMLFVQLLVSNTIFKKKKKKELEYLGEITDLKICTGNTQNEPVISYTVNKTEV